MPDLLDEAPPRSAASVERWSTPARKRIARLSRIFRLVFLGIGLGACAFIAVMELRNPDDDSGAQAIVGAAASLVFMGWLPGFAIHRILMSDVRALAGIVRDGLAYRGHVTSHERLAFGGMHLLEISWQEANGVATAQWDIEKIEREIPVGAELTVLAQPDKRSVGAVIGDALYVGFRPRFRRK